MVQKVKIEHVGSDVGAIYLSDVGRRNSLGGGVSIYGHGQDQYINYGEATELVATSQVLLSIDRGLIRKFIDLGYLTATFI